MARPDAPGTGHADTVRQRRRISRALDELCGKVSGGRRLSEPDWSQYALGWAERTTAGRELVDA